VRLLRATGSARVEILRRGPQLRPVGRSRFAASQKLSQLIFERLRPPAQRDDFRHEITGERAHQRAKQLARCAAKRHAQQDADEDQDNTHRALT